METGLKLFLGVVSTLLLCIGLYLLIYESQTLLGTFDVVRDQLKEEGLNQQHHDENYEEVSYAYLVASLLNTLEYDLIVDGVKIKCKEHDIDKIAGYNLKEGDYLKQYQYDEIGNIQLITYTSKN